MEFTPIQPLWSPALTAPKAETEQTATAAGSMFADVFRSAVQNVRQTNDQQVKLEYQLATGQIDNPALVTTAITKATTAVELLMQMRNHAVDAYNELMRISV